MSPYIRAYEAGIKLAQAEFFGKYARTTDLDLVGRADAFTDPQPQSEDSTDEFSNDDYQIEDDPEPDYFEARGGYGRMAKSLNDMIISRRDALYDDPRILSEDEIDSEMGDYMGLVGITGRELAQLYGNQAFQAGDQLNMDDLVRRYSNFQSAQDDNPYTAEPVSVIRRGRERQLGTTQASASRRSQQQAGDTNTNIELPPIYLDRPGQARPQAPAPQQQAGDTNTNIELPPIYLDRPGQARPQSRPSSDVSSMLANLRAARQQPGQAARPQSQPSSDVSSMLANLRAARQQPQQAADYNSGNGEFEPVSAEDYTPQVRPATQSSPRTRESASELLARVNAMPRKVYDNVVGPTYNVRSAPSVNYQAPSGRGDLGGYSFAVRPELQGNAGDMAVRRSAADMDTRLQGLRSSLSRGGAGQAARMGQLGTVMDRLNIPSVDLTAPSGESFNFNRDEIATQYQALRGQPPSNATIPVQPKGVSRASAPNIPRSGGLMGSARSSNRQLSTPVPDGVPRFGNTAQSRANTNPATGRQFSAATSPTKIKLPELKQISYGF